MSRRRERYLLAVQLAQEIALLPKHERPLAMVQARDDILDELAAENLNRATVDELLNDFDMFSRRLRPVGDL